MPAVVVDAVEAAVVPEFVLAVVDGDEVEATVVVVAVAARGVTSEHAAVVASRATARRVVVRSPSMASNAGRDL